MLEPLLAAWVFASATLVSAAAWAEVARVLSDESMARRHAYAIAEAKALQCLPRVDDPLGFLEWD